MHTNVELASGIRPQISQYVAHYRNTEYSYRIHVIFCVPFRMHTAEFIEDKWYNIHCFWVEVRRRRINAWRASVRETYYTRTESWLKVFKVIRLQIRICFCKMVVFCVDIYQDSLMGYSNEYPFCYSYVSQFVQTFDKYTVNKKFVPINIHLTSIKLYVRLQKPQ